MHLALLLRQLSPDRALLTATLGICLIFLELNRPGRILPGAAGLLVTLLAGAALLHHPLNPWSIGLLAAAGATLALNLYCRVPIAVLATATLGLMVSFRLLLASHLPQRPIHNATALSCGGTLGLLAAILSRIAFRARRAKAVH